MDDLDDTTAVENGAGCAGRNAARSTGELLRLLYEFNFKRTPWPRWIDSEPRQLPGERVFGETLSVTFINHATALLQIEGMNIMRLKFLSRR